MTSLSILRSGDFITAGRAHYTVFDLVPAAELKNKKASTPVQGRKLSLRGATLVRPPRRLALRRTLIGLSRRLTAKTTDAALLAASSSPRLRGEFDPSCTGSHQPPAL